MGGADADEGGDNGRDQNVNLGFLADSLTAFGGDDGDKQHCQRAARAAQQVAGIAHGGQREQHQRWGLQGVADSDGHSGAAHEGGQAAYGIGNLFGDLRGEKVDVELAAEGIEDGADEQGAEKALCHGPQCVDAVALRGKDDVLALQKFLDALHGCVSFTK